MQTKLRYHAGHLGIFPRPLQTRPHLGATGSTITQGFRSPKHFGSRRTFGGSLRNTQSRGWSESEGLLSAPGGRGRAGGCLRPLRCACHDRKTSPASLMPLANGRRLSLVGAIKSLWCPSGHSRQDTAGVARRRGLGNGAFLLITSRFGEAPERKYFRGILGCPCVLKPERRIKPGLTKARKASSVRRPGMCRERRVRTAEEMVSNAEGFDKVAT
ncbi:hypothetical protein QBC47DRAFT_210729 [Echria macrotheca]|uniref:Uncharacterized protein n=1 Tax=Echria macrotheca TaxID=438768 RepID=A0AAJ0BBC5_9PEZI|nr:hypothetical protein QBC47DRAFT_210729 [Echria macrotheca]